MPNYHCQLQKNTLENNSSQSIFFKLYNYFIVFNPLPGLKAGNCPAAIFLRILKSAFFIPTLLFILVFSH